MFVYASSSLKTLYQYEHDEIGGSNILSGTYNKHLVKRFYLPLLPAYIYKSKTLYKQCDPQAEWEKSGQTSYDIFNIATIKELWSKYK